MVGSGEGHSFPPAGDTKRRFHLNNITSTERRDGWPNRPVRLSAGDEEEDVLQDDVCCHPYHSTDDEDDNVGRWDIKVPCARCMVLTWVFLLSIRKRDGKPYFLILFEVIITALITTDLAFCARASSVFMVL